jgi:hypothetical protein
MSRSSVHSRAHMTHGPMIHSTVLGPRACWPHMNNCVPKFSVILGLRAPKHGPMGLKSGPIMGPWSCESGPIIGHGVGLSLYISCVHVDNKVHQHETEGNMHNIVLVENARNLG